MMLVMLVMFLIAVRIVVHVGITVIPSSRLCPMPDPVMLLRRSAHPNVPGHSILVSEPLPVMEPVSVSSVSVTLSNPWVERRERLCDFTVLRHHQLVQLLINTGPRVLLVVQDRIRLLDQVPETLIVLLSLLLLLVTVGFLVVQELLHLVLE